MAFLAFNAFALFITNVWETADASRSWFHCFAFWWNDNFALFHPWQRCITVLHAVQFGCLVTIQIDFAISWAQDIIAVWSGDGRFNWKFAVSGSNAHAVGVSQKTFLAEASNDAVLGANSAWVWVVACSWTSSSTGFEYFIVLADWWWHHHHVQAHFLACFEFDAFASGITNVSLFASASWSADFRADWMWVIAGAIATLALAEFFIDAYANLWFNWHWGIAWWISEEIVNWGWSWSFAFLSWYAGVHFISEETWFAETADDALTSANWTWMRIGACWCAC